MSRFEVLCTSKYAAKLVALGGAGRIQAFFIVKELLLGGVCSAEGFLFAEGSLPADGSLFAKGSSLTKDFL